MRPDGDGPGCGLGLRFVVDGGCELGWEGLAADCGEMIVGCGIVEDTDGADVYRRGCEAGS